MTDERQERIRRRAHAIWEQAGRPDGAHQQHWDQAAAEIDGGESGPKAKLAKSPAAAKDTKPRDIKPKDNKPKAAKPRKGLAS
ncbi:MAG: DUF2934 domain-containing protein [Mesorhizobium sp.]|uniref:DUF2934 domain-containing protein n=1 Tax=Mesorhizobium sp. TaxID=1871066 RepID=UPI0011FEC34E|nr:DUF2934 domain-containing protein [Mesorhizobium sp.]TIL85144.1 MAG: DUF2934 domain-containing protein [Mesorhizobium sp.]TIL97817.1 MAG: DUF2934 domain-containing protein [Mesorhizobium sp.]